MSTDDLVQAVAATPMPDFYIRQNHGRFYVKPLTHEAWSFLERHEIPCPGSLSLEKCSCVSLVDGIFDEGLTIV